MPVNHGHSFQGMYSQTETIEMKNKILSGFYFDNNSNIVGYQLTNLTDGVKTNRVFAPFQQEKDQLFLEVDSALLSAHDTTRLIGFRSGKTCHGSKAVNQIQPIYYSIDKQLCTQVFKPIEQRFLSELPFYGEECGSSKASTDQKEAQQMLKALDEVKELVESRGGFDSKTRLTIALLSLSFLEGIVLIVMMCTAWCKERSERKVKKRV